MCREGSRGGEAVLGLGSRRGLRGRFLGGGCFRVLGRCVVDVLVFLVVVFDKRVYSFDFFYWLKVFFVFINRFGDRVGLECGCDDV